MSFCRVFELLGPVFSMQYKFLTGPHYALLGGIFAIFPLFFLAKAAMAQLNAPLSYVDVKFRRGMDSGVHVSLSGIDLRYTSVTYDPHPIKYALASAPNASLERFLLDVTNWERSNSGLKPLKSLKKMDELAATHSFDMCRSGVLAHESERFPSVRQKFRDRMKSIGLSSGAENIAFHSDMPDRKSLAKKIVEGWMKSPEHRTNILNPKYGFVGFGVKVCKDGLIYVTQLFTDGTGGE